MIASAQLNNIFSNRRTNVLFECMSAANHACYKQKKVFAEAYLLNYIAKYRLDCSKFEPEKPDIYVRSIT